MQQSISWWRAVVLELAGAFARLPRVEPLSSDSLMPRPGETRRVFAGNVLVFRT